MNKDYILTVKCLCFNHEKYLRRCLDSIINQNTQYKYKILIHDDASTDGSRDIIEEYQRSYPELISTVLQEENQYSKGISISKTLDKYIDTKYACICECDDYWCSENKIEEQVSFLEGHSEYSVCCHSFLTVNENEVPIQVSLRCGRGNHEISIEDVIMNNNLPQTATLLYRQEIASIQPEYYKKCMVGDYPLMLYLATVGKMFYIDNTMSCYRRHEEGSWVTRTTSKPELYRKHVELLKKMLLTYDVDTNYVYSDTVGRRIDQLEFLALKIERNIAGVLSCNYYHSLNKKEKMKIKFSIKHPNAFSSMLKMRSFVRLKKSDVSK